MNEILFLLVTTLIEWGFNYAVDWVVRRVVDGVNNFFVEIGIDKNGDGVLDPDEVVVTVRNAIPELKDGMTLCNDGKKVGIGFPEIRVVDAYEVDDYIIDGNIIGGDNGGMLVDLDNDGDNDVLIPLPYDATGDGRSDWGWLVDEDDDGLPDADDDLPFFPVGSPEYNEYLETQHDGSIIMVSPDGTMSIYDMEGNLTKEDCDTAYSLWVSENNILDKPLDYYSVSEGILFLMLLIMTGYFIAHLFKRKDVYR